ncbi:predicted protein [Arabidopsis lyrata subsp. lyrata]|uniref:Predicted protein n=1 Tax=Arabidopsis lyrata subsp. lyrata TaxID=81972 RepID=D7LDC1_ARALL|nr:predicted protein [Arabidopsis lyrata subsp. lyrata]
MAITSLWRIFSLSHGASKPQKLPIHTIMLYTLQCFHLISLKLRSNVCSLLYLLLLLQRILTLELL